MAIGGAIHGTQLVLLLLLSFVIVFGLVARKLNTPYPIVLVVAGLLLSFIPGLPRVAINPDIIFLVILPPLLYAGAWTTSWRDFSYNLVSILMLAIGLVGFTVFAVARAAPALIPSFDWRSGFVLGAVVATTDAIAATAIARRVGLPRRIVDVLEGESLVNDATGLLALEFGLAMLATGTTPSVGAGLARLAYLIVAGIAVGLAIAAMVDFLERKIDDAPIEVAISILVPYAAYLAAEAVGASGVLAVVACGLYLSRHSTHFFTPTVRIEAWAVWNSLTFILNGIVFVLIGLQLPYVLGAIQGVSMRSLLIDAAVFSAMLIVVRLIWVFPGAYVAWLIRSRILRQHAPRPSAAGTFVVGWTGMRGVIALAAALALPSVIDGGKPFAQRHLIVFLTFSVILVTLVLQGLSLPMVIRLLGVGSRGENDEEERHARRVLLESAITHLGHIRAREPQFSDVYDDLAQHYRQRLLTLAGEGEDEHGTSAAHVDRHRDVSHELLQVEREAAVRLRDERRISDDVLRQLQQELDFRESRM